MSLILFKFISSSHWCLFRTYSALFLSTKPRDSLERNLISCPSHVHLPFSRVPRWFFAYSQARKYWNSETIFVILPRYSIMMDSKWSVDFQLYSRCLKYCINHLGNKGIYYIGLKVIGRLTAPQVLDQSWPVSTLFLDKLRRWKACSSFLVLSWHLADGHLNSQYAVQGDVDANEGGRHESEKQSRPIGAMVEILGVAKSTLWFTLKKKACTGELSNTKGPGRPQKTTDVDEKWRQAPSWHLAMSGTHRRRSEYQGQSLHSSDAFMSVKTGGLSPDVEHW